MADGADFEKQRLLRNAMGRFATGVTVVTAPGPVGITANSFASVSLDPVLVLWCPAKSSARCPAFTDDCEHFAIHVMSADQRDAAMGFTRDGRAFDGLDWSLSAHQVPLINGCAARFECHKHAIHDGGDHWIVVGQVEAFQMSDAAPLLFHSGQFGAFTESA